MAEPGIDWKDATVKVSVTVHHTATSERQDVEVPLSMLVNLDPRSATLPVVSVEERLVRLESALAAAVTALELMIDGDLTKSSEELVEMLLYPEHFRLAEQMGNLEPYERINLARGEAVFGGTS